MGRRCESLKGDGTPAAGEQMVAGTSDVVLTLRGCTPAPQENAGFLFFQMPHGGGKNQLGRLPWQLSPPPLPQGGLLSRKLGCREAGRGRGPGASASATAFIVLQKRGKNSASPESQVAAPSIPAYSPRRPRVGVPLQLGAAAAGGLSLLSRPHLSKGKEAGEQEAEALQMCRLLQAQQPDGARPGLGAKTGLHSLGV